MTQRMDPRIAFAIAEMRKRLHEPLTAALLAAAVNLSPSRFAHLFRATTGSSPARYLQRLRLERARVLLETTFLSIKEVRVVVGINDPSHFTRDFCRVYGKTPRAWRRMMRAPPALSMDVHSSTPPEARLQLSPINDMQR